MTTKLTNAEKLAKLDIEKKQLEARRQRLQSQMNIQERKNQDRKKYIVGALILKEMESSENLRTNVRKMVQRLPERDKALFSDLFISIPTNTIQN